MIIILVVLDKALSLWIQYS